MKPRLFARSVFLLLAAGALLTAGVLTAGGCQNLVAPSSAYLQADQATYSAIAPEYSAYVEADPTLTPEQKTRHETTVATWKMRLDRATAASAASTQPSN